MKIFFNKYAFNTRQIFTFRTLILGFILWSMLLWASQWLIKQISSSSSIWDAALGFFIFLLILGFFLYFIWNDFFVSKIKYIEDEEQQRKYANYKIEEILLDLQEDKKNKHLIYNFYKKFISLVVGKYKRFDTVYTDVENLDEIIKDTVKDSHDYSYKMIKASWVKDFHWAETYIDRKTAIILYGSMTIYSIFDSWNKFFFKNIKDELHANYKFTMRERRKVRAAVRVVKKVFKEDKSLFDWAFDWGSEFKVLLLVIVIQRISFQYFSKDKKDIFLILSYILSPLSIITSFFD